jgi:hypothetical protein
MMAANIGIIAGIEEVDNIVLIESQNTENHNYLFINIITIMANIFELGATKESLSKLQDVKNSLQKIKEEKAEEERKVFIENHRKKHIFSSYEEALDWCINHPNEYIEWHCKTLTWEEDKKKFKSYEQEYSYDGVMCYDVIRYYTKEQLLEGIKEHIEWCNKEYPEQANRKWWLDDYGKLNYVNI